MEVVVEFHKIVVEQKGSCPLMHYDKGKLESAVRAPEQLFHYCPDSDLFDLAACYAHRIAKAHAFVDGNKRTALMTAIVFLEANIENLDQDSVNSDEAAKFVEHLVTGASSDKEFAEYLRKNWRTRAA